jgi:hypothetical protein
MLFQSNQFHGYKIHYKVMKFSVCGKHEARNMVIIQNYSHTFLFLNVGCHICNMDQHVSHPCSFMITYSHKKMAPQEHS